MVIECQGHFISIARDIIINIFADGQTDRSSPPNAVQLPGASGRASDDVSLTTSMFCERSSRAAPGVEHGTSRALRENHTTRASSQMSITPQELRRQHNLLSLAILTAEQERQRGDSNPCGQSPMDFESISITTRTHCLAEVLLPKENGTVNHATTEQSGT